MARLIALLAVLAALAVLVAGAAGWWAWQQLDRPGPAREAVVAEVGPGVPLARIARSLERQGVLRNALLFEWYGRVTGLAGQVRAGEYRFPPGSTPREVLQRLVRGEVLLHALTIVEGWTFRQMRAAIRSHPAVEVSADGLDGEAIMALLGRPGMDPEGWFLPETYRFPRGTSDLRLMELAHQAMEEALERAWSVRQDDVALSSPYEALILASIIEKETALPEERKRIAGVFSRRLQRGMRLQTDPTVIYGLGPDFEGRLRRVHLRADTPYNTYTRHGLPPTPIALPGSASLLAATQPEDGKALYFVATARPDGSHYFSETLAEHNRAVQRYLETLRARKDEQ